jgi:hypothetical protein
MSKITSTFCGQKYNKVIFKDLLPTSQKTLHSPTETNPLILFRKIFAVCCENGTKHRYTVWVECRVFKYLRVITTARNGYTELLEQLLMYPISARPL